MSDKPELANVEHLDTSGFEDACNKFKESGRAYTASLKRLEKASNALLDSWDGKGRKEYEYQYKLLKGKLEDISDDLYDMYDALLEAKVTYMEADEEMAKAIKYSVEG